MINVIGFGYIGRPTTLMLASHGQEVVGTDYNKELVDTLKEGRTTFKEEGLEELFAAAVAEGITFTTEYQHTDMYIRESPTLQLLECQERHIAEPLKVYDPFIEKDMVSNQYHDFDAFLIDIDLIVIMVKHDEIKDNWDKLKGKVILDCHNICPLEGVYHI